MDTPSPKTPSLGQRLRAEIDRTQRQAMHTLADTLQEALSTEMAQYRQAFGKANYALPARFARKELTLDSYRAEMQLARTAERQAESALRDKALEEAKKQGYARLSGMEAHYLMWRLKHLAVEPLLKEKAQREPGQSLHMPDSVEHAVEAERQLMALWDSTATEASLPPVISSVVRRMI